MGDLELPNSKYRFDFLRYRWPWALGNEISLCFLPRIGDLRPAISIYRFIFSQHAWPFALGYKISLCYLPLHGWSPACNFNISLYFFTACVTLDSRRWYIALLFPLHGWSLTPESGISLKGAGISAWAAYILAEWIFVSNNEILGESDANR